MNKRTKGLLAGAAGAALLLGGGTFALWSDSEQVDGGSITAGNLDVALVGDVAWADVSADRDDSPHGIDLSEFRIVPGDTIQGEFGFEAALEGDNMVAELTLDGGAAAGDLLDRLDVKVTVDGDGVQETTDWDGAPIQVQFGSEDNTNLDGLLTLPATTSGTAAFTVTVTVDFDEDTPDQVLTQATAALGDLTVGLDQVRTDAPGF
ncbi:MAG TPA: alternate-type signal peptide domain-containing protein [Beutenbergiaceae bacterium]|nr:alternate-type signal peptide domain-containing protein [Beutenbergiaceae bacterium]